MSVRPGPPTVAGLLASPGAGALDRHAVVEGCVRAIAAADAGPEPVRAFLSTDPDAARREDAGPAGAAAPLAGVPVAVKDNLATLTLPTTCGSRALTGYRSPFEATAVARLRAAGALVVGKTNLDEFAMGSSTEHSAFGPTRNPVDRSRVPGGSSGGSAAAVAAGIVPAALGSDTGGSVRQPAAFCGVVGIRPTYGRVSRYGLVAFASSLDQIGVFGRTVDCAARILAAISGPDPLDSTTAPGLDPLPAAVGSAALPGRVIGIPAEYFPETLQPGVERRVRAAGERLRAMGAELRPVGLPATALALPAYYLLSSAEASTNLARFDGVRFGSRAAPAAGGYRAMVEETRARLGPEVRRRIVLGTFALSAGHRHAYYQRAQAARERVAADFLAAFRTGIDFLLTPTTPTVAFRLGERSDDPYSMYRADAFTVPASLAGLPALSLPVGRDGGLPVGAQLIGPPGSEASLLGVAAALEAALGAEAHRDA